MLYHRTSVPRPVGLRVSLRLHDNVDAISRICLVLYMFGLYNDDILSDHISRR